MIIGMQEEDFLSSDVLKRAAFIKFKKSVEGDNVNWMKIQWLQWKKEKPLSIFYKCTLSGDMPFYELSLKSTKPG